MACTLAGHLGNSMVLECDRYHRWSRGDSRWLEFTHLDPKANYIELMNEDVAALRNNQQVFRADYDHGTGTFTSPQLIQPADHIIACGLHTFMCPEDLYDVRIFMDTDPKTKHSWKILRDVKERSYSEEQVRDQIKRRTLDYLYHIAPLRLDADIMVNYSTGILRLFVQDRHPTTKFSDCLPEHSIISSSVDGFNEFEIYNPGNYYDYLSMCTKSLLS